MKDFKTVFTEIDKHEVESVLVRSISKIFAVLTPYTLQEKLFVQENCIKCGNELQLIPTLDTIVLYKSAATWLQALEGVVDEPTEHVSLVLLHLDQFLQ